MIVFCVILIVRLCASTCIDQWVPHLIDSFATLTTAASTFIESERGDTRNNHYQNISCTSGLGDGDQSDCIGGHFDPSDTTSGSSGSKSVLSPPLLMTFQAVCICLFPTTTWKSRGRSTTTNNSANFFAFPLSVESP